MVAPSEAQIVDAVKAKINGTSDLQQSDLTRLLATLELENDWSDVSTKKFQSVLTRNNLITEPTTAANENAAASDSTSTGIASSSASKKKKKSKTDHGVPKSFIDASVDIPAGIYGEYFDAVKGKGLVAERDFAEGELLFTEKAYIATPPPEALDQILRGELCGQCFLPVSSAPVALAIKNCPKCKYRFCTSGCHRTAMATHHSLLCTSINPSAKPLMDLIQSQKWQSLHCAARSTARLLSTLTPHSTVPTSRTTSKNAVDEDDLLKEYGHFETVFSRLSSFATISELERRSRNPRWATEKTSFEAILAEAHSVFRAALDPYHKSRVTSRSTNPNHEPHHIRIDLIESVKSRKGQLKDLFDFPTFLKLLGRANINMEEFGGLYSIHSSLNHSCSPNVQIRHVPERGILASMKIAALALRPVRKGEELLISYIDPSTRLGRRQLLLYRDYCFGPCICEKCKKELAEMGLQYHPTKHGVKGFLESVTKKTATDTDATAAGPNVGEDSSLEDELRASLGF
ncbi:hypothetical protein NDA18_002534 [Ustilago nuda]|nr:hypothetical protein NDA18_002534 [Ustilago nuda]